MKEKAFDIIFSLFLMQNLKRSASLIFHHIFTGAEIKFLKFIQQQEINLKHFNIPNHLTLFNKKRGKKSILVRISKVKFFTRLILTFFFLH